MSNMALLVYGPPPLPCLLVKSFARRCPVLIRGRNGPAVFEVVGDLVPLEIAAIWGAGPRPVPALAQAEPPQQISLVSSASAGERWRRAAASWARLQTGCGTPSEALKLSSLDISSNSSALGACADLPFVPPVSLASIARMSAFQVSG
eukprot:CAMPEP_0115249322 /NCGR_PEP_ID=MMETSP0270-20121206/42531_1 /TAXON_ID=71861 /ORGANISM="Scrippsiella trochoidea, Strain CCMP3099" /LENGTH=147 /DNA_ID=CAMNT_0002664661 /DNA_START=29 /DNA_END=473 /DNA_ORIENTATION=+